jgi:hypothetical protein
MAKLYIQQEKYEQAEVLCAKALSTLREMFDKKHPKVKQVLDTMTQLQYKSGAVAQIVTLSDTH